MYFSFGSIEELRTLPSAVPFQQQRSMSVSMTKEQQQQQSGIEWSPLQVASSTHTRLGLAPQMARPLLISQGNSQISDLRLKQQMLPPELPLRRGGSTDRVLPTDFHNTNTSKSSSNSKNDQFDSFSKINSPIDLMASSRIGDGGSHTNSLAHVNTITFKVHGPNATQGFNTIKCAESSTVEVISSH